MKIVIPDDYPPILSESDQLERLRAYGEVKLYNTKAESRNELVQRLKGAQIVINIRAYTVFDEELLDQLPDLKLISILGTGTDNVDLKAATRRKIVVTNTPGASTDSVAEHTLALLLSAARRVAFFDRNVRSGSWEHKLGIELRGKTIGILGLGKIGQRVAEIAKAFGMQVIAWSFTQDENRAKSCGAKLVSFEDIFSLSDVVSIHVRLSKQTEKLVGKKELSLMKPSAILINTARGAIVDEITLVEALKSGQIAGAGLDVFSQEPLPTDSPFLKLPNVVITPHLAWVTYEASARLAKMPVDNVINFLQGRPTFVVNPEAL